MASYVPAQFFNINASLGPANVNLVTVPAGHKYILDVIQGIMAVPAAQAGTIKLQISDTAGANFRDITATFSESAGGANTVAFNFTTDLSPGTNGLAAGISEMNSIRNLVMEPGQILRMVIGGLLTSVNITGAGIDYTI